MDNKDWFTLASIFAASVITTIYELVSKNGNLILERSTILIKLIGAVLVAFFIMPGIMEYFNFTLRITLLVTVIVTYGLDAILKVVTHRVVKTIDKDNDSTDNNNV